MITKKIRIQFVDTDASGRIHYSSIFRYFEIMDHDFFRRIGYSYKKIFQLGLDMPRVHVECDYLGNIEYDDELEAGQAGLRKLGIRLRHSIIWFLQKEIRLWLREVLQTCLSIVQQVDRQKYQENLY